MAGLQRVNVGGDQDPLTAMRSAPAVVVDTPEEPVDPETLEKMLEEAGGAAAADVDADADETVPEDGLEDTLIPDTPDSDDNDEEALAYDESARWGARMRELGLARLAKEGIAVDLHDTSTYLIAKSTGDAILGKLVITWYQIVFVPLAVHEGRQQHVLEMQLPPSTFAMPLASIDRLELLRRTNRTGYHELHITGKAVRSMRIQIPDTDDGRKLIDSLRRIAFPEFGPLALFAFVHRVALLPRLGTAGESPVHTLDYGAEWARQGVLDPWPGQVPCPWRETRANASFELCPTYARSLVVPAALSDADLRSVAAFRSEKRLPALTWGRSGDAGSIWRCAQPKVGANNTCGPDERMLAALGGAVLTARLARASAAAKDEARGPAKGFQRMASGTVARTEATSRVNASPTRTAPGFRGNDAAREARPLLHIVDCRPKAAALANRATGYGYELATNYPTCHLQFYNISNIHAMRDSFSRIRTDVEASGHSMGEDANFGSVLHDSRWLQYIALLLDTAYSVAALVHLRREPVLVHCSHGWDRTSQVCSLAQLLLDPFYRTIDGFAVLVEKDWCGFGHPFHLRTAHGVAPNQRTSDGSQCSPIFIQWLDAVHQLVQLFPAHFEFSPRLPLFLADALYSCRFGTFLCDSERERVELGLRSGKAVSVWAFVRANRYAFASPLYVRPPDKVLWPGRGDPDLVFESGDAVQRGWVGVLLPPRAAIMRGLKLWADLFCRYSPRLMLPHRVLPSELLHFRERVLMKPKGLVLEINALRDELYADGDEAVYGSDMLLGLFRRARLPGQGGRAADAKWRPLRVGGTMDLEAAEEADLALGHLFCAGDDADTMLRLQELRLLRQMVKMKRAARQGDLPTATIVEAAVDEDYVRVGDEGDANAARGDASTASRAKVDATALREPDGKEAAESAGVASQGLK